MITGKKMNRMIQLNQLLMPRAQQVKRQLANHIGSYRKSLKMNSIKLPTHKLKQNIVRKEQYHVFVEKS